MLASRPPAGEAWTTPDDSSDLKHVQDADQFWEELSEVISRPCETHELIDDTLRRFIELTSGHKDEYLGTDHDLGRCCFDLASSHLFTSNRDYVRRQFVYSLLQEDEAQSLHIIAAFLLFDGRSDEETFQMMQSEGTFPRLLQLINGGQYEGTGLHRLFLELLCDMARIQQLSWEDLRTVDDDFILYMFQMIEELSDDASDPYHYPIIRILLVLNEQYMCLAQPQATISDDTLSERAQLTNRIIKVLSSHGPAYRTFGENLILLLNRESALGPQLLILKLLYLLFTTPATYEYFYTNDLHVLVDVIIRNLLDLDFGSDDEGGSDSVHEGGGGGHNALRHTYLRVLCPLLRNTQLAKEEGHYKRDDLRKLFYLLVNSSSLHFAPVDMTVIRLVSRCKQVDWIREPTDDEEQRPLETSITERKITDSDVAKQMLGMNLLEAGDSSLSVLDVASKVEKQRPTVPAPRRRKKRVVPDESSITSNGGGNDSGGSLLMPPSGPQITVTDNSTTGSKSPFADDFGED